VISSAEAEHNLGSCTCAWNAPLTFLFRTRRPLISSSIRSSILSNLHVSRYVDSVECVACAIASIVPSFFVDLWRVERRVDALESQFLML
jgi:hypothetical protein